ncbi:MAG: uncharacterized protein QOI66_1096 [Myxococcales bacterium]|jgi:uncharacterized protein YprB with RNaseH-like and TPR domain|nr:uncharacterized protein [Myxococcales bacterium]
MLTSTFQLARGVGPRREQQLWRDGITSWRQFPEAPTVALSARADSLLRAALLDAETALTRGDCDRLAALLPSGEHWRLFSTFGDDAAYLDIETGDDDWGRSFISAIGIWDREGPRFLLAGRDLALFPALSRWWSMLVTFNGLSFDVPVLRQAFPDWQPPGCHVDLRHLLARLGHHGGLKAIERKISALNLARPPHLAGIDGWDASRLFRHGQRGDRRALRLFAEYNLYDVVNLRTLMAYAYNAMVDRHADETPALRSWLQSWAPPLPVPARGDGLYDISKILLAL